MVENNINRMIYDTLFPLTSPISICLFYFPAAWSRVLVVFACVTYKWNARKRIRFKSKLFLCHIKRLHWQFVFDSEWAPCSEQVFNWNDRSKSNFYFPTNILPIRFILEFLYLLISLHGKYLMANDSGNRYQQHFTHIV